MKSLCLLLLWGLFVLAFAPCSGQTTFAFRYQNGYRANMVCQVADGGFVLAGGEDGYGHDRYEVWAGADWKRYADMFMMKTNAQGAVVWQKAIGLPNSRDHARWLQPTSDGGFILLGSTTIENNAAAGKFVDSSDIVMVKTDASGNVSWAKRYDSGKDDWGWSVVQTSDGGYMISAFVDLAPVSLAVTTRAMLIKTDNLGNVQWEGKYRYAIRDFDTGKPFIYVTKQTMNGGYILVGSTFSTHQADLFAIRLNSAGVVQWAKSYDAMLLPNLSGAYDVLEAPDSSFIVTGFMDKNHPLNQNNYPYAIRLSKTGAVKKAVLFDYNSFRTRTGFSSVRSAPGGYVFTGSAGYGESGEELVLVKTDTALNLIWGRHYDFGGPMMGGSRSAVPTGDLGYVLAGQFSNNGISLLRMDSLGNIACNTATPVTATNPIVSVVNWIPDTVRGITATPWFPNVTAKMELNLVSCPLNVPLAAPQLHLSLLSAIGDKVDLAWTNEVISNITELRLECNCDGKGFRTVDFKSRPLETDGLHHQIETQLPSDQAGAYRLQMTDQNGGVLYSNVVWVNASSAPQTSLIAFQQQDLLRLRVADAGTNGLSWVIRDMTGRTLHAGKLDRLEGHEVSLDLGNMSSGVYVVVLSDPLHGSISKKFHWQSDAGQ